MNDKEKYYKEKLYNVMMAKNPFPKPIGYLQINFEEFIEIRNKETYKNIYQKIGKNVFLKINGGVINLKYARRLLTREDYNKNIFPNLKTKSALLDGCYYDLSNEKIGETKELKDYKKEVRKICTENKDKKVIKERILSLTNGVSYDIV